MKRRTVVNLFFFLLSLCIFHLSSPLHAKQIKGEKGIPGVLVSNQKEVVQTDDNGRFKISVDEETIIFITKPAGYITPVDDNNLPQFYYIHQPKGSPELKYGGVEATGKLPNRLYFPLFKFEAIF